jgi:hypothetical protein
VALGVSSERRGPGAGPGDAFALAKRNRDENSPRLRSKWWSGYVAVT